MTDITAEQPELIREMLRPAFYPHPTAEPIKLLQTHISWVLLTGDYAYKVKKPVNLGFLDFSTLEGRRQFCQEEVRLNRRGAPELYLDVLAVTRDDAGRLGLGGAGNVVEYAVKMRQFPQECLCRAMLERGALDDHHVRQLARTIAEHHGGAGTNAYIASFGEPERLRESIELMYHATQRFIGGGGPQSPAQFEATKQFTDGFLSDRSDLLLERARGGHVRECHGDLHLNNICFWEDRVLLFDCIEFSEPLRFVDTAYDTAFTVMDFEAHGRAELGNSFLNAYHEQTGDWEALRVLPLYLCRQAYVRAKVNSIRAEELAADAEGRRKAFDDASRYYTVAWSYTRPRRGRMVIMSGLSGSGKSTMAHHLAGRIGAVHIRSDAVRKHLAYVSLNEPGGDELYSSDMSRQTYARLIELGASLAGDGYFVILDAKFDRGVNRTAALGAAHAHGVPCQIVHCTAPTEVLRERLLARRGDVADATADLLHQQTADWDEFSDAERPLVTEVDTSSAAACCDAVSALAGCASPERPVGAPRVHGTPP